MGIKRYQKDEPLRLIGAVYTACVAVVGAVASFGILDAAQSTQVIAALGAVATAVSAIFGRRAVFNERSVLIERAQGQIEGQVYERKRSRREQVAAERPLPEPTSE